MESPEEKNEILELFENLKPIFIWIQKNNTIFTYGTILFLFSWYLNPIIKESKFKNMCALNTTKIKQKGKYAKEKDYKELGEKFGLVYADWKDINRFCEFYKSSHYNY